MADLLAKVSAWSNACVAMGVINGAALVANLLDAIPAPVLWVAEAAAALCIWRTLVWARRLRRQTAATAWIAPVYTAPPAEVTDPGPVWANRDGQRRYPLEQGDDCG